MIIAKRAAPIRKMNLKISFNIARKSVIFLFPSLSIITQPIIGGLKPPFKETGSFMASFTDVKISVMSYAMAETDFRFGWRPMIGHYCNPVPDRQPA